MVDTPNVDVLDKSPRANTPENNYRWPIWATRTNLIICFCFLMSVVLLSVDFISANRRIEMVQLIANSAASKAAQELPMFESTADEIERVREKLSGCRGDTTVISAVPSDLGEVDVMTMVMNGFTSVQVVVKTQSASIFGRFSPFGSSPISAQAVAVLLGSGKTAVGPSQLEVDKRARIPSRFDSASISCEA